MLKNVYHKSTGEECVQMNQQKLKSVKSLNVFFSPTPIMEDIEFSTF